MVKWWRSEPVMIVALLLVAVMVVQMIIQGKLITEDLIVSVIALLGGGAARQSVYSKATVEDWNEHDDGIDGP